MAARKKPEEPKAEEAAAPVAVASEDKAPATGMVGEYRNMPDKPDPSTVAQVQIV